MAKRFRNAGNDRPSVGRVDAQLPHNLALAKKLRSSSTWQKCRNRFIKAHPLCCNPFNAHHEVTAADQVHHIKPVAEAPELLCEPTNLASLCVDCHGRVEGMERAGKSTTHLFKK